MTSRAKTYNRRVLAVLGPLLIVTGLSGLFLPARLSILSAAIPYALFHLGAGLIGVTLLLRRGARAGASFNLSFGLVDLWQAVAGVMGWPPAALFALGPPDHLVHLILGGVLVVVGSSALTARGGTPS